MKTKIILVFYILNFGNGTYDLWNIAILVKVFNLYQFLPYGF